jgi:hypothetical protein
MESFLKGNKFRRSRGQALCDPYEVVKVHGKERLAGRAAGRWGKGVVVYGWERRRSRRRWWRGVEWGR